MSTTRDPRPLLRRAMHGFGRRLAAIPADAWQEPTTCAGWTVRDLVDHVVEEELWAPPLLAGEPAEQIGDRFAGDRLGDDPQVAFDQARAAVEASLRQDGVLDATVRLPSGEQTGRAFLWELFADHLVHTWDLARAAGGDETLDRELVEACAAWFDDHEDAWRAAGEIGPPAPVPAGAGPQAALLARFGRDVRAGARA